MEEARPPETETAPHYRVEVGIPGIADQLRLPREPCTQFEVIIEIWSGTQVTEKVCIRGTSGGEIECPQVIAGMSGAVSRLVVLWPPEPSTVVPADGHGPAHM